MKSKEKILSEREVTYNPCSHSEEEVFIAMDIFAKQQAIEFAKWCIKNDYWNHPNVKTFGIDGKMNEGFKSLWYKRGRSVGGITDNAIYELYLLHLLTG